MVLFYNKITKKSSINIKIPPYKIELLSNKHKRLKTNKKNHPIWVVLIWYSVLSEYRAKHLENFKKLAREVELLKF